MSVRDIIAKDPSIPYHDFELYIFAAIFLSISSIGLALRLYSRRLKSTCLSYDDFLVILAWVATLTIHILYIIAVCSHGFGKHVWTLQSTDLASIAKYGYALAMIQSLSLALSKLSVCWQLHRIFGIGKFRWVVRILGAIVVIWFISITASEIFLCTPIQANLGWSAGHRCGNGRAVLLASSLIWIITDFAILVAPIPLLKRMKMPLGKKIGVIAIFLTGSCTCVIACARLYTLFILDFSDMSWSAFPSAIWTVIETNMAVFCACMITILPALRQLYPERIFHWLGDSVKSMFSHQSSKPATSRTWTKTEKGVSVESLDDAQESIKYPDTMEEAHIIASNSWPRSRVDGENV